MSNAATVGDGDLVPGDSGLFDRLIAPWVIESMPQADPRWQRIVAAKRKELQAKVWRRKVMAAVGLAKPIAGFRKPSHVRQEYNRIWAGQHWPQPVAAGRPVKTTHVTWRGQGYVVSAGAVSQPHLDRLMHVIGLLKPRNVLEVGAGAGQNLFAIAGVFPAISFAGLELSESGLRAAHTVKALDILPPEARAYGTRPHADEAAFKRIDFHQGTAAAMPYATGSFDLVFSRLAIEQMNAIQDDVFKEMARVCARHAVMIEPFADFASNDLHRLATLKKNHFGGPVSCLPAYGLSPVAIFSDWPQKLDQGSGMVVACRTSTMSAEGPGVALPKGCGQKA